MSAPIDPAVQVELEKISARNMKQGDWGPPTYSPGVARMLRNPEAKGSPIAKLLASKGAQKLSSLRRKKS